MPSKFDDLVFQVEAVLFAAGKPLSVKEITDALGLEDYRPVQKAVRTLEQTYEHRQSALEVRRVGTGTPSSCRSGTCATVHSVTPVEMAPRTLKALTLVAYHQPILQSVLVRMIGDVAYEEVQHLRALGLVHTEPKGSTLELTTTQAVRRVLRHRLDATRGDPAVPRAEARGRPDPGRPRGTGRADRGAGSSLTRARPHRGRPARGAAPRALERATSRTSDRLGRSERPAVRAEERRPVVDRGGERAGGGRGKGSVGRWGRWRVGGLPRTRHHDDERDRHGRPDAEDDEDLRPRNTGGRGTGR